MVKDRTKKKEEESEDIAFWQKPVSSNIDMYGYDEEKNELVVKFKSDTYAIYEGVPRKVYVAMKLTGSKGQFLHQVLKGKFKFRSAPDYEVPDSTVIKTKVPKELKEQHQLKDITDLRDTAIHTLIRALGVNVDKYNKAYESIPPNLKIGSMDKALAAMYMVKEGLSFNEAISEILRLMNLMR